MIKRLIWYKRLIKLIKIRKIEQRGMLIWQKQKRIIKKKEKAKQTQKDNKFKHLKSTMNTFYKDIQEEGNNE